MVSAKDIIISRPTAPATMAGNAQDNALMFRALRDLMHACGTNKHDKVDVLITALIDKGINTGSRIIGAASRLDCDRAHVAIRLKGGLGDRWTRDNDGTYRNLM